MKTLNVWTIAFAVAFFCTGVFAAAPVVSNVRVVQRPGTGILDITYDLADPDSDLLSVAVNVSTNDGASWFSPAASNLTGAVGSTTPVAPGVDRSIVWCGEGELRGARYSQFKVKVLASQGSEVAWYRMDDNTTTRVVVDSSPTAVCASNIAQNTSARTVAGVVGTGLSFLNDEAAVSTNAAALSVFNGTSWTVAFWGKRANTNYHTEWFWVYDSVNSGMGWYYSRDLNAMSWLWYYGTTSGTNMTCSFPAGTWRHFVFTRSGSSLRFYVDGALSGTAVPMGAPATSTSICFGGDTSLPNYYTTRYMDDLRIYGMALTDENVATLYNRGSGLKPPLFGGEISSDVSSSMVYDLAQPSMAVGYPVTPIGDTNFVQEVGDHYSTGDLSIQLGGGGLPDGGMAGIEWSATGPGVMAFDWMVSSEEGKDGLRYYEVGGTETNFISGTGAGWTRVFATVSGATNAAHTFRWEYVKDPSGGSDGMDCGWIDALCWAPVHTLTVGNGSGSGAYTNGAVVGVTADVPPAGTRFNGWTGDTAYVSSVTSSSTFVTMPTSNVSIAATYINVYALTVNSGSGSGLYTNGQWVAVTADAPPTGKLFSRWTGETQVLSNALLSSTFVRMPSRAIGIAASYVDAFALTVNSGGGDGLYPAGQRVTITADPPPFEMSFDRWTGDVAAVSNVTSSVTTVVMPASAVTVTASYFSYNSLLPESRVLDFNDYLLTNNTPPTWVHQGPTIGIVPNVKALLAGTNHFHRTGWRFISCRTGCSGYLSSALCVPPLSPATRPSASPWVATNLAANLRNDLGAFIESPVFTNGVGTVYFEAINELAAYPTQITVELATNMVSSESGAFVGTVAPPSTNGLDYVWGTLDVLDLNAATTNDFVRYRKCLNVRLPAKLRIRRSGAKVDHISVDDAYTVVDNIRVSPPPCDVVVERPSCVSSPGYPSAQTPLTFRCVVSNADTNAPTVSRTVSVCARWRYRDQTYGPWTTNALARVEGSGDGQGNGELYEGAVPTPKEVGDVDYYFICAFSGPFYTSPDYTLTGLNGYPYPTENLSPRVCRGAGAEYSVRVRPYASEYGGVAIESEQLAAPLPMTLVGDGVWRGLVPVGSGGLTNFTWRFKAGGAYEAQTHSYSADVVYWAGDGETARVPFEGACTEDDGSGRLCLSCRACGYAMVTLDTRTLHYRVQCAEAQDFNAWPAPPDVYTESCSQVATRSFAWGSGAWPTNAETTYMEPFSSLTVSTNVFSREPFPTPAAWVGGSSAYVSERTFDTSFAPTGVASFLNLALRLKNGDSALRLGYVRNSEATLTDGIKSVSFRSRLEQPFDNYDIAYWRWGFTNYNYLVRATARAVSANGLSPEAPSLSLIAYYIDPGDFYEFRVTAIADPSSTPGAPVDKRVMCELYKWMNGVPALLTQAPLSATVADTVLTSVSDGAPMEMRLYNASAAATQIRCKFLTYDSVLVYTDIVQPLQYGTFGFVSGNCFASLSSVMTYPTASGAYQTGLPSYVLRSDSNFSADVPNWYFSTNRYVAKSVVSPKGIYSVPPVRTLGVYVCDAESASSLDNNGADWKLAGTVTVTNFIYQANTVPVNAWKRQYVKLQAMGGDDDVAVDEVAVTSWHGKQAGSDAADSWLATEAWVVSNSASRARVVRLDHSKGNPDLAQGVRSLLLTNGLGALEFNYRVVRPPARLTVQYAFASRSNEWFDLKSVSVTNSTDWLYLSAYLGKEGAAGYFRIVNARSEECTNACIEIDSACVWDAPHDDGASWRVYNARITDADAARVALDGTKACFLNNSQTAEALPIQDQHEPYVQSPALANGFGYVSFAARAYNAGESATVRVLVTTNGWSAADAQWFEVKRFENITNTLYQTFVYDVPSGLECDAVRLVTHAAGGEVRACLDDVVVAEPLVPFADLVGVSSSAPRQTILKSGGTVDIALRLAGRFGLRKGVSDASGSPQLAVIVNGEAAWAPLHALSETQTEEGWRTDATFRYTVRPGDMAAPLRLTGVATQRRPYQFQWNGWEIYNQTTSSNAVWRFAARGVSAESLSDPDLACSGPVLRTLTFDSQAEGWVSSTRMQTFRVLTDTDVGLIPFQVRVWTPQTNVLQIGMAPGPSSVLADVASIEGTGIAGASVAVVGRSLGTAEIYVQRLSDFDNNAASGATNYIKRTITVVPAPLRRWGDLSAVLTGGGIYRVDTCETDAGGAWVVCDGGGGSWVYRFVGDRAVAFTNLTLSVSNGATVVIENLNIDNRCADERPAVSAVDGHPGNTLGLIGENAVWGGRLAAGACVQAFGSVTQALCIVSGGGTNGALTAQGGVLSAGIGGCMFESGGALSIRGHAVVTAVGGDFGAGVGGGIEAAGGSVDVADQAVLMATGGRDTACDIGPGTYCSDPASLRFSGGLILTGTGVGRVSDFAAGRRDSRSVGVFDPLGWYALSRNGEPALGRMCVAAPSIGVYAVSNVTQAGVYALTSAGGGGAVTFQIAWASPAVPVGSHGDAAFYAAWLDRHGVGALDFSTVAPGVFDAAWLLDQNPQTFVSGEVAITEFHLEAGVVRGSYTVRAKGAEGSQTVTHLNGRLVVMGANALTDTFVEMAEITASLNAGTYAFEIPCAATTRFIRIAVVFPE